MKRMIVLFVLFLAPVFLFPQNSKLSGQAELIKASDESGQKLLSGKLISEITELKNQPVNSLKKGSGLCTDVILYFSEFPSAAELSTLTNLGVGLYPETWTPPLENHPYGFMIATIPVDKFQEIIQLSVVRKIDSGERQLLAANNDATLSIGAQMAWKKGYSGKGVKLGILDSGLDLSYSGTDLPSAFPFKDYAYYPSLDDSILNKVSGHGTHVTATALGRGILSDKQMHWNNGKGAFKGTAPAADLVFLKIGLDGQCAGAREAGIIAAIDAAVNIYDVDILSMSYGGWNVYHDGSSAQNQKIDWAYSKGVPFFCSAGNNGESRRHFSGKAPARSASDWIDLKISNVGKDSTMLSFNLVWADGPKRNNLILQYYDSGKNLLANVTTFPVTQSLRGTESQYSRCNVPVKASDTAFYLKVVNNSDDMQQFHIYEDWTGCNRPNHVTFSNADPSYTIVSPADADHAFSVGAYVSKTGWTSFSDKSYWRGASYVYNMIAPFSSRGPRIDGMIKPEICAPGSVILSLRDQNIYKTPDSLWIDNDGITGGESDYYCMRGTSMACPVASGAAALYLEKFPGTPPSQVYEAIKNFSNQSGLGKLPDNTWGSGKLDIYSTLLGKRERILIDGDMSDFRYSTLAKFNTNRNGYGDKNSLGELKFYSDGENLCFGITGEVKGNDNIVFLLDFSGCQGKGKNSLGDGNVGVFSKLSKVTMDFDVDYALAFNKGNSKQYHFFVDAIRFGNPNSCLAVGKTNQMGASSNYEIGSFLGGTGFLTAAYDSTYSVNPSKGIEFRIPVSAFAGVDTSQTLRVFAVIASMEGEVSNECIPGDPGPVNPGTEANFSSIPGQDFFTQPFKISSTKITGIEIPALSKPAPFLLGQNYPNPFNNSTSITYQIPVSDRVLLKIYDFTGKEIATLVNRRENEGEHTVVWKAGELPSGIYFYKLVSGVNEMTRKLIVIK